MRRKVILGNKILDKKVFTIEIGKLQIVNGIISIANSKNKKSNTQYIKEEAIELLEPMLKHKRITKQNKYKFRIVDLESLLSDLLLKSRLIKQIFTKDKIITEQQIKNFYTHVVKECLREKDKSTYELLNMQ